MARGKKKQNRQIILKISEDVVGGVLLFLKIIFLPITIIYYYLALMKKSFVKWVIINIVLLLIGFLYFFICYKTLPDIDKLYNYKPVLSSKFYDRNNELIFEIGNEKREYVDIKDIPQQLINAFISAEDKTFYTNSGIDVYGLMRTGVQDIYKFIKRQKLGGASTITQQVVKNVLLSNERTLRRKFKEIVLSYRISKIMPKDKIMEIYLNHIYLGIQAYGVRAAAEEYFDKSLSQLTIPEMAMLASLPKAPSAINPFRNHSRAVARRNWVLYRMYEDGYITKDEYENYRQTELVVKRKSHIKYPFYAPSFFAQNLMSSNEVNITNDKLLQNGYKITLTIDGELQKIAQDALNNSLDNYSKNHGYTGPIARVNEQELLEKTPSQLLKKIDEPEELGKKAIAVVLQVNDEDVLIGLKDNSNGKITLNDMLWAQKKISETSIDPKQIQSCHDVVSVGDVVVVKKISNESDYYSLEQIPSINGGAIVINPKTGEILAMIGGYMDKAGAFNRAVQAFRQLGSTIKPFVYATALEHGYTPTSIFMDADININLENGTTWNPANHTLTTNGPTTMRIGLERSKNTITVRVAEAVGIRNIRQTIINSGINQKPESNLSIALGSVESTLVNIVSAFSTFATNGKVPATYLISNIENNDNNDIKYNHIYFSDCDLHLKCKIKFNYHNNKTNLGNNSDNINEIATSLPDEEIDTDNDNNGNMKYKNITDANNEEHLDNQKYVNNAENSEWLRTPISPESAYQIANILQGAVIRGTSSKLAFLNLPIGAKTGTSDGGKDMWTIAFSSNYVIGAYVGYDAPIETNNYGSQYALPIVRDILTYLSEREEIKDIIPPSGIKFVKINRFTGRQTTKNDNAIFEAFKENDKVEMAHEDEISDEQYTDITDL